MQIELTDEEKAWIAEIVFVPDNPHEQWHTERNQELASLLTHSIFRRDAVPKHRKLWFIDPVLNPGGRGKSRKDAFQGSSDPERMIRHPHFLRYLHYFIFGPKLPQPLMAEFDRAVRDCGMVTSGDVDPLCRKARELARRHGLDKRSADEFYKLALETMGPHYAGSIRDAVMQVR